MFDAGASTGFFSPSSASTGYVPRSSAVQNFSANRPLISAAYSRPPAIRAVKD